VHVLNHRALSHFILAYDEAHFGRAAELAHITQPAMSKSIAKLEDDLGVPLFERTASGVEPTRFARILRRHAQNVANELRFVSIELAALTGGTAGTFSLGVGPAWSLSVFPPYLIELRKRFPTVDIHVRIGVRDQLVPRLLDGSIDVWLGSLHELDNIDAIMCTPTGTAQMTVFAASNHPLAHRSELTLADLSSYDWANFIEDTHGIRNLRTLFAKAGLPPPRQALISGSVGVMFATAAATETLVYSADTLAPEAQFRGLVRLQLREPLWSFPTGLAYRHAARHLAIVSYLEDTVQSALPLS
jgi:DNA-binding transcriptional LysR family regulator